MHAKDKPPSLRNWTNRANWIFNSQFSILPTAKISAAVKVVVVVIVVAVGWALSKTSNSCDLIQSNAHLTLPKHHFGKMPIGGQKWAIY